MSPEPGGVSDLLRAWGQGDARAREDLMPLVYRELRRRAGAYLRNERRDHTLQPTALVHEAYVRLVGQDVTWQNRAQFFGVAAQMMRRILVDHARRHHAAKRPGADAKVTLDDRIGAAKPYACEILWLDQALRTWLVWMRVRPRSSNSDILAGCRRTRSRPSCRFPAPR